eukprot:1933835-Prymnesium_polylepis.1
MRVIAITCNRARARGRTGMSLAAAVMQRSVPRPERMRGEMSLHSGYAARSASPRPQQVSTPTPHTSTAHTAHHWPGDTCRLVLDGAPCSPATDVFAEI